MMSPSYRSEYLRPMEAVEAFALFAGHVDEELLLRNEYLAAENEILLSKLSDRLSVLITRPARNDWPLGDRMEARRHGFVTRTSTEREPGGTRERRKYGHSADTKFRATRVR